MGIENLQRWHWIVIGLVVGLVVAYVHLGLEPSYPRTIGQREFEQGLQNPMNVGGEVRPVIRDVIVHPEVQGVYNKPVQVVTFQRLTHVPKEGGWKYLPYAFRAELPYTPTDGSDVGGSLMTFLSQMKQNDSTLSYHFAWWEQPKWTMTLWAGGCILVIGGLWPFVIDLLIGAGLARPRKTREERRQEKAYLDRFGKGTPETAGATARRDMTAAEMDQLEQMGARMEKGLAAAGVQMTGAGADVGAGGAAQPGGVKKLDAGPLQIEQIQQEQEEKEYKGEFYPVARPVHQQHEPPGGPQAPGKPADKKK